MFNSWTMPAKEVPEQVDAIHTTLTFLNSGDHFSLDSTTPKKGFSRTTTSTTGSSLSPFHSFSNIPGDLPERLGAIGSLIECLCFFTFNCAKGLRTASTCSRTSFAGVVQLLDTCFQQAGAVFHELSCQWFLYHS